MMVHHKNIWHKRYCHISSLTIQEMIIKLKSDENIDFHNGKLEIIYSVSDDKNINNKDIYFDYYYDLR